MTLEKAGGTGDIWGFLGGGGATANCNSSACLLPSVGTLTRANSLYNFDPNGTSYPNGQWCTAVNGGGTCYAGDAAHLMPVGQTLYAMWSCAAGYYYTSNACAAVGAGYYSPNYDLNRTQCQPGNYCVGTTAAYETPCPVPYTDSAAGATAIGQCRRACPLAPGAASMVAGGWEYQNGTNTCEIETCLPEYDLEDNKCVTQGCAPGEWLDNGVCTTCAENHYCEDSVEIACPHDYPRADIGNDSIDGCYTTCDPIQGATFQIGRKYYNPSRSTCAATQCGPEYNLVSGLCVLVKCPVGRWAVSSICEAVGIDYYSPVDDMNRYACAANKKSGGDGSWAAASTDCVDYKTLKVNDGTTTKSVMVRATALPMTTPALNIKDASGHYYGNLSSTPPASGQSLRIGAYHVFDAVVQ